MADEELAGAAGFEPAHAGSKVTKVTSDWVKSRAFCMAGKADE
jgi:hypothetical protein